MSDSHHDTSHTVAVIGGGIAGLVAAFQLKQRHSPSSLVLIEQGSRLGGKLWTEHKNGFTVEAGPDSFLAAKQAGIELCKELNLKSQLEGPRPECRRTYVMRDGALCPMPDGLSGLVPSRLGPLFRSRLLSVRGKSRVALDYVLPSSNRTADESLADFIERRLGTEVYDRLVEPLMGGIYAGDGRTLSLSATFPQLREAERRSGSLLRGLRAGRRAMPQAMLGPAFLAPRTGMGEIAIALERELADICILRSSRVLSLRRDNGNYVLRLPDQELRVSAVIVATPAFVSADLLDGLDPDLAALLRSISYVSTATVSTAYRREDVPHPLDAYGYIVPRKEGRPVLACTWVSSKWTGRTPSGYVLLRAFVGRAGQQIVLEGGDDELLEVVEQEFQGTLGITTPPALHWVFRWDKAMPQYTLGHLDRMNAIRQRLRNQPGIFLAGNAYSGVGIPDCIQSGRKAATQATTFTESLCV